jgi:hypothetical protein
MKTKYILIDSPCAFGDTLRYTRKLILVAMFLSVSLFTSASLGDTIIDMEYYIDYDPGAGNAIPIPPVDGSYDSAYEIGQASLDTNGMEPGPHLVYVRARKSNGVWGTYPPVLLYIYQRTAVVEAEYYIDTDPGLGKGTSLEPSDGWFDYINEMITTTIPIEGLSFGKHKLYVRARNSAGIWGISRAFSFDVLRSITVSAAECGFGRSTDIIPTFGTYPMQAEDFVFDSTIEDVIKRGILTPPNEGDYRAFVRAKDDRDVWGPWFYTDVLISLDALLSSASDDIAKQIPGK